jgi:hypothetical protein
MTNTIKSSRYLRLTLALLMALAQGVVNATTRSITGSNFTILDATGSLVGGGATDVNGSFDDTKICTSVSCTEFAMTLASNQPFFGVQWLAHNIRVFREGSYLFDTNCTGAQIAAGTTNCGGTTFLTLTVGPGQLGAHMLFDWNTSTNIDVAILWDLNSAFGSPIYNATDATQTPTRIWDLASTDGNSDGIRGITMVDGPFVGFNANFNLHMTPPFTANTPPVANNDSVGTTIGTPVSINVAANDTDAEDGSPPPTPPAVVTVTSIPTNGSVVNNNNGTVTYTPNPGYNGPDSFHYTLTDSGGAVSNTATVNIPVSATVNGPRITFFAAPWNNYVLGQTMLMIDGSNFTPNGSVTFTIRMPPPTNAIITQWQTSIPLNGAFSLDHIVPLVLCNTRITAVAHDNTKNKDSVATTFVCNRI